jgi:hypothetical protein
MLTPKEDRPCCNVHRDDQNRLPIGFCSPTCLGRVERDEMLAVQGTDPPASRGWRALHGRAS